MKTTYKVKNFRCFDSNGAEFDIAPITLLTGANGAGKSSLVKSLMVLNSYLSKNSLCRDSDMFARRGSSMFAVPSISTPLLFSDGELKLGRFDNALNQTSGDNGSMTFEYSVDSKSLGCRVNVEMVFRADENDAMNNGWLSSVTIKNDQDEVVYYAEVEGKEIRVKTLKFSWFKTRFRKAAIVACSIDCWEWLDWKNSIGVDPEFGFTEESIRLHEELEKRLKKYAKEQLISGEWNAFLNWFKSQDENLVSTESIDIIENIIKYGVLTVETDFVKSLCEMSTKEAIEQIKSIPVEYRDAQKVEANKAFIIESLRDSKYEWFRDWYSAQEDLALDNKHMPDISDTYLIELKAVRTIHVDYEESKECEQEKKPPYEVTFDRPYEVTFDSIASLLYLADEEYVEEVDNGPNPLGTIQCPQQSDKLFLDYLYSVVLKEVLVPDFANALHYIGSAQVSVQRLYSNQNGNNSFSDLLLKYFNAKRNYFGEYVCDSFLNKWLREFGIGDSLTLKNAEGGLGLLALLHQTAGDEGRLLADEGYGITQLLSIILNIEVAILTAKTRKTWDGDNCYMPRNYRETIAYAPQTLAIEESEIHLHPRLQSLLADMFFDAYTNYNVHFIVETHSEYLIRKSQVIVANQHYASNEEADSKAPFKTYYMPNGEMPYSLGYRKDGRFEKEFGKGFYDEAASLMFEIL